MLLILKEYRDELNIFTIDCPPTGLLCCTNLNPISSILEDNYFDIVKKYADMEFSLNEISDIYPVLNSKLLLKNKHDFGIIFKPFE